MKRTLIIILSCLLFLQANSKRIKYLRIDLLHVVLVSDDGKLVNDSSELSQVRNYFNKGFQSGEVSDYKYADTIVKIIMENQFFFMGMNHKDLESLLGTYNRDYLMSSYRMVRWDMKEPIEKTILFFRFRKGKIYSIQAPYNSYCCAIRPPRRKIWEWFSPPKPEIWPE